MKSNAIYRHELNKYMTVQLKADTNTNQEIVQSARKIPQEDKFEFSKMNTQKLFSPDPNRINKKVVIGSTRGLKNFEKKRKGIRPSLSPGLPIKPTLK